MYLQERWEAYPCWLPVKMTAAMILSCRAQSLLCPWKLLAFLNCIGRANIWARPSSVGAQSTHPENAFEFAQYRSVMETMPIGYRPETAYPAPATVSSRLSLRGVETGCGRASIAMCQAGRSEALRLLLQDGAIMICTARHV